MSKADADDDRNPIKEPNSDAAAESETRVNRRRWLLATLALVAALLHVPVVRSIIRRWNRRSCEFIVDWPAAYASNENNWGVELSASQCQLAEPLQLNVNHVARRSSAGKLIIMVTFKSKGSISNDRRMGLAVEVLDSADNILARERVDYGDERLQQHRMAPYGSLLAEVGPHQPNSVPFQVDVGQGRPARIRLTFTEEV